MKDDLMKIFSYLIICLSLLLISCSDDQPTSPNPQNTTPPSPTLSDIQAKIFNSCASADCHSSSARRGNLVLESGQSHSNLVNVQSTLFPQFKRVQPGSGGNSLLIKILKGDVSPRMPLNRTPLSNDVIDSIEVWINAGALNN